ncbi:MAG: integrase family protein [Amycolatopsis sp.]|uniref:phage integrase N-terminal SAM-like domain-containing protein n=1 Tax=Amycolatopsis sp. TaxID=37632 RepID=UPI00261EE0E3|nr:phage integrase N-terminal SAM-like domain-containing protein [Amycolatopsis sp.]MCU1688046.1 integrase family protein [Amycolatopsis sp.]
MSTNLTKQGLPRPTEPAWRSYVEEWVRSLRAQDKPHTTRYNYELAVTQLAEFLAGPDLPAFLATTGMDPHDDSDAAQDPTDVERKHVDWFITWMIDTRSAATALNKYKCIQQLFKYLIDEDELERHPMAKLTQPNQPGKLIPIVRDDELAALLRHLQRQDIPRPARHRHHPAPARLRRPTQRNHHPPPGVTQSQP